MQHLVNFTQHPWVDNHGVDNENQGNIFLWHSDSVIFHNIVGLFTQN